MTVMMMSLVVTMDQRRAVRREMIQQMEQGAIASGYHEQAGSLLRFSAATETGLLTQLEEALPPAPDPTCLPLAGSAAVRRRLLLTLLFLGAVGLPRAWDLRGYTADSLALLTGRKRAYGYRYTEAFLSQVAYADGADGFTSALAL